ncbi:unnamed protein product [Trifolium pratense]|uniref:Uncharacterized protein n=1 Tax=Trifolium pratense TaxID=57577 RepID=A0ACB0L789_TRIPR|nr:unnamed protein product [Trifolium pratense]
MPVFQDKDGLPRIVLTDPNGSSAELKEVSFVKWTPPRSLVRLNTDRASKEGMRAGCGQRWSHELDIGGSNLKV